MYYIYALKDPDTNHVIYVGMSKNLRQRYSAHMSHPTNSRMEAWINELKARGKRPKIDILDCVKDRKVAKNIEGRLIVVFARMEHQTGTRLLNQGGVYSDFNTPDVYEIEYLDCSECGESCSVDGIGGTAVLVTITNPVNGQPLRLCPRCGNVLFRRRSVRVNWERYWQPTLESDLQSH